MKSKLKIVALLNFIEAILFLFLNLNLIYVFYLLVTSFIYIKYSNKDNISRNSLILLALTSIINPVVTIILYTVIKNMPKTRKKINKRNVIYNLGIILLLSSLFIFIENYEILNIYKFILILIGSFVCFIIYKFVNKKNFYIMIGEILIILSSIYLGKNNILFFSFTSNMKYLTFGIISILISTIFFINYKKYKIIDYLAISQAFSLLFVIFILQQLKINISLIVLSFSLLALILNVFKINKQIYLFGNIITYILGMFLLENIIESNQPIIYINLIMVLLNLIILKLQKQKPADILLPLYYVSSLPLFLYKLNYDAFYKYLLIIGIAFVCSYLIIILLTFMKTKLFENSYTICINLALFITLIYSFIRISGISIYISLLMLIVNIAYHFLRNYKTKLEYYLTPFKIILFIILLIYTICMNEIIINYLWILDIGSIISLGLYILTKNKKLKIEYFLIYYILLVLVFVLNLFNNDIVINIFSEIFLISTFYLIYNNEKLLKLKIPTFILSLIAISLIFNSLSYLCNLITLVIYILSLIIIKKNKPLLFINLLLFLLPTYLLLNRFDGYLLVIGNSLLLYLSALINIFLIKKHKNICSSIMASIILFISFLNFTPLGVIYECVIAIIIMLIGYLRKNYRTLFQVGLIGIIFNIPILLLNSYNNIYWIYLLVLGAVLVIIGSFKKEYNYEKKN